MALETDAPPPPDVPQEDAPLPPYSPEMDAPLLTDSSETNACAPADSPGQPVSLSQQGSGRPPFKACITDEVYVLPPSRMIPDNPEDFIVSLPLTVGKELNALRKEDSWSLIVETCKSCKFHARAGCNAQKSKNSLLNIRKFAQACQEPDLHIARFPTPDIYHRRGALEVYLLPPVNSDSVKDVPPPIFLLHSRLVTRSWPTAGSLARSMMRMPSMAGVDGLTVSVSEPDPPTVAAKQPAEDIDDTEGQYKEQFRSVDEDNELALEVENDNTSEPWRPETDSGLVRPGSQESRRSQGPLRAVDEDIELALDAWSDETSERWQPEADSGLLRLPPGDALATPMSSFPTSPMSPLSPWQ